jgi:TonB-linked SusC/RagA family outer membrane protein
LLRLHQNRPNIKVFSTSTLEIKPISSISIQSSFTENVNTGRYEEFSPRVTEPGRTDAQNYRTVSSSWNNKWIWENVATYIESFDAHQISAMAGFTMQYTSLHSNSTSARDFDKEDEHYAIFTNANDWAYSKPSESISEEALNSVFGRIGYSYADRYFATASIRRDASSKLAPENNYGIFPAFSGSWKISSEKFFHSSFINLLKLRAGWGQVGNVALVPNYSYNVPLSMVGPMAMGVDGSNLIYGLYQNTISNRNLKWETTEQTSVGLDISILSNSLSLSVDYFHKLTKDLIDRIPISQTAGIATEPYGNVGSVLNRGWEISANYTKYIGEVEMNISGNVSTVKSEVKDLGGREELTHSNSTDGGSSRPLRSAVGQPWYSYKLIKTDGLFQTQEEIDNYTWTDPQTGVSQKIQPNAVPGDLKFIDYNDDGIINDDDRQYMGSYLPELTYSFGADFKYRNFDFSFFFQGISGVKIYSGYKKMGYQGRNNGYVLADVLDSWTYNKNSNIPRLSIQSDPNNNFNSDNNFFLDNGSYLRLKNVTIGYTLPKTLMQQVGMRGMDIRIYASSENTLTFTDYRGFDPEVGNTGLDGNTYPIARVFNFGLNLIF